MKKKLYTLEDDLKERLKNPEFKKTWEKSEAWHKRMKNKIDLALKGNALQS